MKTTLKTYTVREVTEGFRYSESEGRGLFGLDGKLTIQPEYQRNYLYADGARDAAVVRSVLDGHPVGLLYFVQTDSGALEILDGQQRVTSIGRYVQNLFAARIGGTERYFRSLDADAQKFILDSDLLVYICEGTEAEIKDWFRTINIAGIPLNDQELLNAVYSGPFVTAAKAVFSNSSNANIEKWSAYLKGAANRQDYLATALDWVSGGDTPTYMAAHRTDTAITELKNHFDDVIAWVGATFTTTYPEMRMIDWGRLYREYGTKPYSAAAVDNRVADLYGDHRVTSKKGVFEYILGGEKEARLLNVRLFDIPTRAAAYKQQTTDAVAKGESNCPLCAVGTTANKARIYTFKQMEADHVSAWSRGGTTTLPNCQMLCKTHNGAKGNA